MSNSLEFRDYIKQSCLKRIVDDGNVIQQLISKIDLQLSLDQEEYTQELLNYLLALIEQLDADCSVLANLLD